MADETIRVTLVAADLRMLAKRLTESAYRSGCDWTVRQLVTLRSAILTRIAGVRGNLDPCVLDWMAADLESFAIAAESHGLPGLAKRVRRQVEIELELREIFGIE